MSDQNSTLADEIFQKLIEQEVREMPYNVARMEVGKNGQLIGRLQFNERGKVCFLNIPVLKAGDLLLVAITRNEERYCFGKILKEREDIMEFLKQDNPDVAAMFKMVKTNEFFGDLQEFYFDQLKNNQFQLIENVWKITQTPKSWEELVQGLYQESLEKYKLHLIRTIREKTNIAPDWSARLDEYYWRLCLQGAQFEIKQVEEMTGIAPDWKAVAGQIHEYYFKLLMTDRNERIEEVRRFTGVDPDWAASAERISKLFREYLMAGRTFSIKEIEKATGIAPAFTMEEIEAACFGFLEMDEPDVMLRVCQGLNVIPSDAKLRLRYYAAVLKRPPQFRSGLFSLFTEEDWVNFMRGNQQKSRARVSDRFIEAIMAMPAAQVADLLYKAEILNAWIWKHLRTITMTWTELRLEILNRAESLTMQDIHKKWFYSKVVFRYREIYVQKKERIPRSVGIYGGIRINPGQVPIVDEERHRFWISKHPETKDLLGPEARSVDHYVMYKFSKGIVIESLIEGHAGYVFYFEEEDKFLDLLSMMLSNKSTLIKEKPDGFIGRVVHNGDWRRLAEERYATLL